MNVVVPNRVRRGVPTGGRFKRADHAEPASLDLDEFPYEDAPTGPRVRDMDVPRGTSITLTTRSPLFTDIELGRTAQAERRDDHYAVGYVRIDLRQGLCPGQPAEQADRYLNEHRAEIHGYLVSRYGAQLEGVHSWEHTDAAFETYLYPDDHEDEIAELLEVQTRAPALYEEARNGQLYRDLAAHLVRQPVCFVDAAPVPTAPAPEAPAAMPTSPVTPPPAGPQPAASPPIAPITTIEETRHDRPLRPVQRTGCPGRPGPLRRAS